MVKKCGKSVKGFFTGALLTIVKSDPLGPRGPCVKKQAKLWPFVKWIWPSIRKLSQQQ
jgi:hypothetical protein